ncbi:MAG: AAA domain-containing protein [bacterium]|nr:AAA domain-containing protein [bacterium]
MANKIGNKTEQNQNNGLAFIKEVAKYFMDFLETDFHKRRNPKRSIQLRNSSNLLIGLNLNKYPSFNTLAWKAVTRGFDFNVLNTIQAGVYRTNIPKNLLGLIGLQLGKIKPKQISEIIDKLAEEIEKSTAPHLKEYDQALTTSLEVTEKVIKAELVLPFISNLEKSLENLNLGDENSIYLMEEELTAVLVAPLENKISEIVKLILAKTEVDVAKQVKEVFEVKDVKSSIVSFFENFQVGDLFAEIYEMERNRTILDKQEFYLYFCDITFNNAKYPIFYIPFSVSKQSDALTVEFDSQVYINKKALEYITQEYNKETNHHGNLQSITDRIIYLAQYKENFGELVGEIMNEITNFFKLDKKISITDTEHQIAKSLWVRASNARYIALFDKSDEALVNDYEEILKLLASGDSILAGAFNQLIDDFIYSEPKSFKKVIDDEWDETETSERLVFNSPIPLNSEQRQILSAIKKDDCKYIIVEGPPGTGKSHTITAIAFDHILKDQSVLVLSDKKEALDVVEDKITETLNTVRYDKNFQNPILRLGKTGSTYSKILATTAIENIRTNLRAVKKNHDALESDIEKVGNTLKEDLQAEILAYGEIDLKEIHELIDLETYFEEKGFPLDIDEAIKNPESAGELEELRSILVDLKVKLKDYDYDFDPKAKPSELLINNIKSALSLLKKFQTDYDKYFQVADIRDKATRLHKDKTDFTLSGESFLEIENYRNELSSHDTIYNLLGTEKPRQFADVDSLLKVLFFIKNCIENLNSTFGPRLSELSISATFSDFNYKQIQWFIEQYESLKLPILGYLFRGKQVEELNAKFKKTFKAEELNAPQKLTEKLKEIKLVAEQIFDYKKDLPTTIRTIDLIESLTTLIKDSELQEKFKALFTSTNKYQSAIAQLQKTDWYKSFAPKDIEELRKLEIAGSAVSVFTKYKAISNKNYKTSVDGIEKFLNDDNFLAEIESLKEYSSFLEIITDSFEDLTYIVSLLNRYPKFSKQTKIDETNISTFIDNELLKVGDLEYSKLIRYLGLQHKIKKNFADIPPLNYAGQKRSIEELVTAQMTHLLDNRLIDFYDNNRTTATALRDIIRQKRRFPRDKFLKLKEAFPCILAGIRDYAEYIPLEPEIFDLVIIDEASQVSIAQAFPALLRAKKVLILGDKKQFSNVKSAQARTETNREYLNDLKATFLECVSDEETNMVKLGKFNIKTSILEFCSFITNYNTQLLKHFRGYKEIISYSNKYFYQDSLQVMKIRGKAIDEVLRFSFIKHDGKKELTQNTNSLEAEFIISELQRLKKADSNSSVGIITPHTNQQKLLVEMISKLLEKDYFYDKLNLKIMTFDTCQGEERDIIYYSLVATEEDDHLWGVFIKDLSNVDIEEDGKIKAQRLNVGLSRAKECMYFVLSKPIEKYNGSIGEALRHYYFVLAEARKERSISETDVKSKMEPKVMDWFYKTDFWKKHKDDIEFIPQFELGKYLKQLEKTYNHPNYIVDFLLVYKDEGHKEHKIIIEYDGFREHFTNIDEINEFNYEDYHTEAHVYREKVLESYGYKFLRINKFNVGDDPVATLNERIGNLIKNGVSRHSRINHIHETIEGLQNGDMKECSKCKEIRTANDFRDSSLLTKYGRFCKYCKGHSSSYRVMGTTKRVTTVTSNKICPRCGAKMILRNGRRGKFYGCSKFPYCKGTRSY